MKMIQSFDPSAAASGTFDPQIANPCGHIYLFNESAQGLQLSFSDGSNASLPPYYFRSYYVAKPGIITWTQLYTIQSGGSPLSVVVGEAYESQEARNVKFTEGPLGRQTSIGNSIPLSTSSSSIANDGNAANTQIIEATVAGDAQKAVTLTNDAVFVLGDTLHPGSTTMAGPLAVASTITLPNNTAIQIKDSGGIARAVLFVDGSNRVMIQQAAANQPIRILDNTGALLFQFGADGNLTFNNGNGIFIKDSGGTSREIVFVDGFGNGRTVIKQAGNSTNIMMQRSDGTNIFRLDNAGNLTIAGALTQNGTP